MSAYERRPLKPKPRPKAMGGKATRFRPPYPNPCQPTLEQMAEPDEQEGT